jgi:benzoyl-CoA reductase/2-hydroxyglutaryl-CoA dehydratase subunit BcrC/BadD/HgdB
MNKNIEPLVNDGFDGQPAKRVLNYVQSQREKEKTTIGIYCGFAPLEIIHAMDAVPAILCAFANAPIAKAETILPANLCPLIKSSYGYIMTDTCPFYTVSEAVIAETTCDGKKKMFELISHIKPTFVMDLPQLPDEVEAKANWTLMIRKLQSFLETTFNKKILDKNVEAEIKNTNRKIEMMSRIFDFTKHQPPVISWSELYDLTYLGQSAKFSDIEPLLEETINKLEKRLTDGVVFGNSKSPRVLVTGSPVGGDAAKVLRIIEELGGNIVFLDLCTGMKLFLGKIAEDTADPYAAIAERYLKIPCSCMTPNTRRLEEMGKMIEDFKPDVIIEVVLHACHAYNIESHKIGEYAKNTHGIPYLKIETDYSEGDIEQIRTRVEALFESI